jgi:hypothetical protein
MSMNALSAPAGMIAAPNWRPRWDQADPPPAN